MLNELNKLYMPYVSRAKTYGGPAIIHAVGPALLTNNYKAAAAFLEESLIKRFGVELAKQAISKEFEKFKASKPRLSVILTSRYKETYDKTAAT